MHTRSTTLTTPAASLLAAVALFADAGHAFGGDPGCDGGTTVLPGLYVGQTWGPEGSPYHVTGDIDVSLHTILPGVTVCLAADARIEVLSTIVAEGTEEAPIVFTAGDLADPWWGLRFQKTPPGSSFRHCVFEHSERSALTLVQAVPPILEWCAFRNNTNPGHGGAISTDGINGVLTAEDCLFEDNTANPAYSNGNYVGGAVYVANGDADFARCRFFGNRANSRCSDWGCGVLARGGAVYVGGDESDVTVTNCEFQANRTDASNTGSCAGCCSSTRSFGGGLYINAGTASITNCLITCNSTTGTSCVRTLAGSGLYVNGGMVTVCNSTIARNSQTGVHHAGGALEIKGSIIYFNNADGTQIGGNPIVTFSDVQGAYGAPEDMNINFSPVFANDDCDCPDFRIVLGSPAIDAGPPEVEFNDCAGVPAPSLGGPRNDMGAHGGPDACGWACWIPADIDCSGEVDVLDLVQVLLLWGDCESCAADVDCSGAVDVGDLVQVIVSWSS
jgi:hypothetical protein